MFWKKVVRRVTVILALVAFMLGVFRSAHAQTYINNRDQVPLWNQHHDYRGTYQNLPSAIPDGAGGFVTYGNLSGDARVFFAPPNGPFYSVNPAPPRRQFAARDFWALPMAGNNLAGGGWHCSPTATGMWMEWLRQNAIPRLADRGGEVASISGFAQDADTNQQRDQAGDGIGRLGTYREKMIRAADAYVGSAYGGLAALFRPVIRFWRYTPNSFKQMIDRNKPPVIFYRNVGGNSGHVVVGVGYDDTNAIVRDPWDAAEKPKRLNTIQDSRDGGGNIPFGDNPPSADFDASWEARLAVMEIPNRGSAPYPYQVEPASHQSALREWLGATVIPDVDPFDPPQDNGDGIRFLSWNPGGTGQLQAIISSKAGMVREDDSLPPVLYLNGWIDWNNDGFWDPANEQIIRWTGPADFEGSLVVTFDFAIPSGAVGPFWARFRLDRGENVGPYGLAQFGEMEDYLVGSELPTSVATYLFQDTLRAEEEGVATLMSVDPLGRNRFEDATVFGQTRRVFHFDGDATPPDRQGGLALDTTGLVPTNKYSLELVFAFFDRPNMWRRILSVDDRQADEGFYVEPGNHLQVFPVATGSRVFTNNVFHHVVLTVANTGVVRAYLDGSLEFTVQTNLMNISNAGNLLHFFLDNIGGLYTDEYSTGQVALIRLYADLLSDAQVAQLAANSFP